MSEERLRAIGPNSRVAIWVRNHEEFCRHVVEGECPFCLASLSLEPDRPGDPVGWCGCCGAGYACEGEHTLFRLPAGQISPTCQHFKEQEQ